MDCIICMEKVAKIETSFLKTHVKLPCNCRFDIHIKCYNNWRLYTTMVCPICRIQEQIEKKVIVTFDYYFFALVFAYIVCLVIILQNNSFVNKSTSSLLPPSS